MLIFQQTGFSQVAAVELNVAGHLQSLHSNIFIEKFRPIHLRYLQYDNLNNNFKLLLDKGDQFQGLSPKGTVPELESVAKDLLNYFFVGISLPNDTFWVNLRPDSPDNIIDPLLAQTEVGKILLEADFQLKKDTARATSPETPEGKEYRKRLYQKAAELYGNQNITIPTLTRPWIVPDEIIIRESTDSAYIYKATLKVILEQDYLKDSAVYNFKDDRLKELNEFSSQLIREIILPKLTKEINSSKRYASLRQIYYSLIMAQWFKARFYDKGGLYSRIIDRKIIIGMTSKEYWSKTIYFQAYQKSFKDGEYNIQEPAYSAFGQTIRSYFSGGEVFNLGRMPTMGGVIRNPETGTIVSSIPTASSPVLNPKVVIGVKVNATDNPGELRQVQIESRGIEVSTLNSQGKPQETETLTPHVTDFTGDLGTQLFKGEISYKIRGRLSNPFFWLRMLQWPEFALSNMGLSLARSLGLEKLSIFFARQIHSINVPDDKYQNKAISTLRSAINSAKSKNGIVIVYYPGMGFDVKTVLLSTDASIIVGVDPLEDARYIENIYISEILALGGKKLEVSHEGELGKGGKLVFRFNYNGSNREVILYREDAKKYTPDVIKETINGYDMFFQIGVPIAPRDFIEKSVNYLNEGGLFLPFADRIDTGENIGDLRLPLRQEKAAPIIPAAGSIWVKDAASPVKSDATGQNLGQQLTLQPTASHENPISTTPRQMGGIDFRNLPIVTQAISNLSVNIGSSLSINRLGNINLDTEWREIENLVNSGITPSAERIKEYVQISCYRGSVNRDIDKVISCISDILRIEEERYFPTEPMLKDILVVLDSASSTQQLRAVFIGTTP
ncbi:MAG: hypothetical protein WC394_00630 [Candidatus Omnitrophota bacterium]